MDKTGLSKQWKKILSISRERMETTWKNLAMSWIDYKKAYDMDWEDQGNLDCGIDSRRKKV